MWLAMTAFSFSILCPISASEFLIEINEKLVIMSEVMQGIVFRTEGKF